MPNYGTDIWNKKAQSRQSQGAVPNILIYGTDNNERAKPLHVGQTIL
jgi:hypothetical protein